MQCDAIEIDSISETPIRVLGINDTLTGEDVVEGFSCQVAQLFE